MLLQLKTEVSVLPLTDTIIFPNPSARRSLKEEKGAIVFAFCARISVDASLS